MLAAGLPAGPVLHVDEAMAAEHTAFRNMVAQIGDFRALNTPHQNCPARQAAHDRHHPRFKPARARRAGCARLHRGGDRSTGKRRGDRRRTAEVSLGWA
jgi:crotonobetainyl-CoA:carnitine CoA-transferase CaiB-like acyl-CoA transferase